MLTDLSGIIPLVEASLEWDGSNHVKPESGRRWEWQIFITTYAGNDGDALVAVETALQDIRARINQEIGGIAAEKGKP